MDGDKKDEELLFKECKESVEDVFGWKILIFLPQNSFWKVFVMITVAISFMITTTKVFYWKTNTLFKILEMLCDISYAVDVLCATLHFGLSKTRQLRHGKKRNFIFLTVDYISLIPLNLFYEYLIYKMGEKPNKLNYILRANAILRIYQIPLGFSDIKQTVCRITTYYLLTFIEVFVYYGLLTHFFSCFLFENFDQELRKKCLDRFSYCIIENDLLTFALLDQNYIASITQIPLKSYIILLNIEFFVGFIFTYGFITPLIIYVNLTFLKEFFEYSSKRKQLSLLIKNITEDKVLKRNITNYFHYTWTYGKGDNLPEILNIFPLSFRKTIFCDIHWEAISHSDFLQNLSPGCKRSLALQMTTEFVLPNKVLFQKQEKKTFFLYLKSGLIQVMTEENDESSVLNFSDGTVLGEISLFLQLESKALLRTGKFSVIHFLKFNDLFRVMLNYPKDMKKIHFKMQTRMQIARAVYKSKTEICPHFMNSSDYMLTALTNVKWIKQQFRALMRVKKAEELKTQVENQENIVNYQRQIQSLETQLEHTSVYLSLLCIDDEGEAVYDAVCLKPGFPWFLDPQSSFASVWRMVIIALALFVVILYPAFLGWFPIIPTWFFNISVLINFMYILDVLMQFVTAVKVDGVLISKFSAVVNYRFSTLVFYLDILAALPFYLFIYFYKSFHTPFKLNLLLSNIIVKSYKLLPVINKVSYSAAPGIFYRATLKYILIMYFSIYWSAAIFNLAGVECIFYECGEKDWFFKSSTTKGENYKTIVSMFAALDMVLDVPHKNIHTDEFASFVVYFVLYIISNFMYYAWQGECIACYILENSHELEYRSLIQHVHEFMVQHKIANMIKKRVMAALEFQWYYDKGNYITQKRRILEDFSTDLRDEIDRKFLLPILQESQLFKWESDQFFVDLCRRANRLAVPVNSLLLTFGTQTMSLYVIQKGYVQVNSFLVGDSHLNISTPMIFKSGDTFPVLVALSQIPAPVTAITVTDCELLIFDLEDILTAMETHKVLPDMIEALKETNLSPMSSAKPGLSRIRDLKFDESSYTAAFKRLKFLGKLLKHILLKKGIYSKKRNYLCWEITRCSIILFNLITWPILFGCCAKMDGKHNFIAALLALDGISSLVDFYLRLHLGYNNNLGIYVLHPLSTAGHYLTSSFFVDLIAFIPNFHMIYLLEKNQLNFTVAVITTHMLMRSVSLYRIVGLLNYIHNDLKKLVSFIKLLKWFFLCLLILHYYISLKVYFYVQGKLKPTFNFTLDHKTSPTKPHEYYFYELCVTLSVLLKGQMFFDSYDVYSLIGIAVSGTLAVLCQTILFSVLTLNMAGRSENFTIYQYYLRSFAKYLKDEKVDENISTLAIKYFKFQWEKHKGVNMKEIFSHFPNTLHEDILFPLYKDTLSAVNCLSSANEAFYRALSRNVQVVTLMKASTIIFKHQVQGDIFFVHKGKCFVEEVSKTLIKGAIIGDIRHGKCMEHTIIALTPIYLLRIPSKLFFVIISNFYSTKKAFESEAAAAEDFMESIYFDPNDSSMRETVSLAKQENSAESEFMPSDFDMEDPLNRTYRKKKIKFILKPDLLTMRVLNFLFFIDAYITSIVVPIFIGITLLSWWALAIIYFLDLFWVFKIILAVRTALLDPKTGNYTYKSKAVILDYLSKLDGMVLHVLSVLPIELIIVAYYGKSVASKHCDVMYYCYFNRLLRIPYIHYYIQSKMKELLANIYLKLLNISVFGLALVNLFVSLNLLLRRGKSFNPSKCHWGAEKSQLDDILKSYLFVLNEYVSGGLLIHLPETPLEIFFHLMIEVWAILSKATVVNQVLVIIYVTQYTKSNQLLKLQQLGKYLSIRNVSPPLLQKMQKYCSNLLNAYKEGAHPSLLKETPPFIRIKIMENLYIHHLQECYIFQEVEDIFLRQLVMRLERFIFFPGDYIIEKGDVDQNMYFVHKGEVKCVEMDKTYPILERTVDLFVAGESFGVMQGIFLACPHMNTYRAKVLTDILVLNYYKWGDLRTAYPEITERIYKRFKQTGATKMKYQ